MPTRNGSIFLFRLFGVSVFLHYSWFLIAALQIYLAFHGGETFSGHSHPLPYHILLYLCLFLIVLTHEFGHSLAAKSVGGFSDTIVLFPFGGVSYARAPERAGATLWTIVAGPLVNVILLPLTFIPIFLLHIGPLFPDSPASVGGDFLWDIACINFSLLIFNLIPAYPLDGGQILRSLLWFIFGRAVSLIVAAIIGLVFTGVGAIASLFWGDLWLAAIGAFLAMQAYAGLRMGLRLLRIERMPRRFEARCPYCLKNPPFAPVWRCTCGVEFDTFQTQGQCPRCGTSFPTTACPWCGKRAPMAMWHAAMGVAAAAPPEPIAPQNSSRAV